MRINKKLVKAILVFYIFFLNQSTAIENKILFKVNNQIITTIDVLNEINYLSLINSDFRKLDEQKIYEVSKNSLIREKIKEIDLKKQFVKLELKDEFLNELIKNYSRRIGFKNTDDFIIELKKNNIKKDVVIKKITIEAFWNQLILDKFLKNVKINEISIKKELQSQKIQREYLLSEILFGLETNNGLNNKINLIKKAISEEGFSKAALVHSISDTSNSGGKLDWINEASLNIKIKSALNNLEIGAHTEPILLPGGYLILKINDIKEVVKEINYEKEFEKVKRAKTNEQLNIMSNLYFNKIKKKYYNK